MQPSGSASRLTDRLTYRNLRDVAKPSRLTVRLTHRNLRDVAKPGKPGPQINESAIRLNRSLQHETCTRQHTGTDCQQGVANHQRHQRPSGKYPQHAKGWKDTATHDYAFVLRARDAILSPDGWFSPGAALLASAAGLPSGRSGLRVIRRGLSGLWRGVIGRWRGLSGRWRGLWASHLCNSGIIIRR